MKIALDVLGGDYAPKAVIEGVLEAKKTLSSDCSIVLLGPQETIESQFANLGGDISLFEVINCPQIIEMAENPTKAVQHKPDSGIVTGMKMVATGQADVICSAGNTGAMMVASMFILKPIKGVIRPVIAGFFPKLKGDYGTIIDVGANADCKPEVLAQFAVLGSLFGKYFHKIDNPKVGLMSLGEEEEKGTILTHAAFKLIREQNLVNFIGNVEGRDMFNDKTDVIVTDGFVGNVILKLGESMYPLLKQRGFVDPFIELFNWENVGGSPILGVNGNVIIGHGSSSAYAIKNMIHFSRKMALSSVVSKIKENFENIDSPEA